MELKKTITNFFNENWYIYKEPRETIMMLIDTNERNALDCENPDFPW